MVKFGLLKIILGIASGDPAAGSNEAYSNLAGTIVPVVSTQDGSTAFVTMNFGQDSSFAGGKTHLVQALQMAAA